MTRAAASRVLVTSTTTGTGTLTLGAVPDGVRAQAVPAGLDGLAVSYAIDHTDAAEYETGIGVYTHAGTTLSRIFVEESSNSDALVNLSAGTKHVRIVPLALDIAPNVAASDPGVNDDITAGYKAGWSRWLNSSTGVLWICLDHTDGAAVWGAMAIVADMPRHSLTPARTVSGTSETIGAGVYRDYVRYTNAGTITVTIGDIEDDAELVLIKGNGAATLNLSGSGVTLNGSSSYAVSGTALVKREGSATDLKVTEVGTGGPFLPLTGGTLSGAVDFNADVTVSDDMAFDGSGKFLTGGGNVLRGFAVNLETVSGSLNSTHIGKRLTTSGSITVPTTPTGWWAEVVLGSATHDITFDGSTFDVSAAGWGAGDEIMIVVTSATTAVAKRTAAANITAL